jgi:hypothetical protein
MEKQNVDPNSCLKELLDLAQDVQLTEDADYDSAMPVSKAIELAEIAFRQAELLVALHEWISKGGVLPQQWRK